MAVDDIGPKGQPRFDSLKAGNTAADENAIGDYAALVGNRISDTSGHRATFTTTFGFSPWEGLDYYETDTGVLARWTSGAWRLIVGDGAIGTAGSVNPDPDGDYITSLRIAHGIVSFVLAVDPGANQLSASSTNSLIANIPAGFRPRGSIVKRAEWRASNASWDGSKWAQIRVNAAGNVEVLYTTATIPSGAVLSFEATWPAA